MLFLISEFAFSAAFQMSVWVFKKTYNGVSYVVSAAVAAYAQPASDANAIHEVVTNDHRADCVVVVVPLDFG